MTKPESNDLLSRLDRILEDLDYIESQWPEGFEDVWPYFDEPREKIAIACREMKYELARQNAG